MGQKCGRNPVCDAFWGGIKANTAKMKRLFQEAASSLAVSLQEDRKPVGSCFYTNFQTHGALLKLQWRYNLICQVGFQGNVLMPSMDVSVSNEELEQHDTQ